MSSAWVYQDSHQVLKHGAEKASWYVGRFEPSGRKKCKSCGPGPWGKRNAEKLRRKVEAQLMTGTYRSQANTNWDAFRKQYEEKVLAGLAAKTRESAGSSLDAFARHARPGKVYCIGTATVDEFIAKRRADPGKKKGSTVSAHTINHDLRHIKAALSVAKEWGLLPALPKFRMERAVKRLPTYVTGDHFAAMYGACDRARFPAGQPYPAADWWRALLATAYLTGWRIGDLLGLRRADLDLGAGAAITRGEDNKGKRDERVKLHPVVVEHLKKLAGFDPHVFPWDHDRRTLQTIFAEVQEAAGIELPCDADHEHTRFCHVSGFHDLRRLCNGFESNRRKSLFLGRGLAVSPYFSADEVESVAKPPAPGVRHHERRQADPRTRSRPSCGTRATRPPRCTSTWPGRWARPWPACTSRRCSGGAGCPDRPVEGWWRDGKPDSP
jgi:integrase